MDGIAFAFHEKGELVPADWFTADTDVKLTFVSDCVSYADANDRLIINVGDGECVIRIDNDGPCRITFAPETMLIGRGTESAFDMEAAE